MVKRREKTLTEHDVETFAAGAEAPAPVKINPNAKRNFKSVRMNFNEYEYNKLVELASKTNRSHMGAIRWAVVYLADNYQE